MRQSSHVSAVTPWKWNNCLSAIKYVTRVFVFTNSHTVALDLLILMHGDLCVCLGQEVAAKSVVVPKERAPAKRRSRRHRIEKKRKKKEKKKKERTRANPSEHVRDNVIE